MAEKGTLSTKQKRFVAALATTPTIRGAASAVGIGERTAYKYLGDELVKEEIARRQDAILGQVTAGLVADMAEARRVLLDRMNDPATADGVRVRAALGVLNCGLRLFELLCLTDRVAALERRLADEQES